MSSLGHGNIADLVKVANVEAFLEIGLGAPPNPAMEPWVMAS